MRILITGGSGFLGKGLITKLLNQDHDVRIYSRNEFNQFKIIDSFRDERLGGFVGDVRDASRLERAMDRVDVVIHAAALKRIETGFYNPDEMVKTNVLGSMNVIEASRKKKVPRVIFVSSDKAYEPVSAYGLSKALAEKLFLAANEMSFGPRYIVCRYGNVAGSTGSVIPVWRSKMARNDKIVITDPDCTRFWMVLKEAVDLVLSAMVAHEPVLIPTLPAYRLMDLAYAIQSEVLSNQKIDADQVYPPSQFEVIGLNHYEKKHESMCEGRSSEHARRMSVGEIREQLAYL